ncbi:hypothetical protein CYMTET_48555 [Cymbomonas tetramitiformis]|uniref:Uncharacterized protein n=1 Tax=Cymbomonas tetramitiformis TaxID=36881 RepID=A0AAE0BS12_9CHLO|nr:hypothetical protein CYMTET_48555 [Cymbomonas tetramitiformis]
MEMLKKLRRLAKPGDWCFSFNLQDGLHALGIHPDFQWFMQFDLQGELFQCSAIPFGWNDASRVFCKFVCVMVEAVRSPQAAEDWKEIKKLQDGSVVRQRWWNGRKIWRSPMRAKLHTDSSMMAWGGVLNLKYPVRGFWPDEMRNWRITHLDLEAMYKTVQAFLKEL